MIYTTRSIKNLKKELIVFSERVDCLAKSNGFISSKEQKPNFSANPKCP